MTGQKHKITNRFLVLALSFLIVTIVLLIAFIILNINKPISQVELSAQDYVDQAYEIIDTDIEKNRGQEVIDLLIRADELERNINSAVKVINAASFYDFTNTENQYIEILRQREIEAGIDPDMEGEG